MSDDTQLLISSYGRDAPDAAVFNKGVTTHAEIKQTVDARRNLSAKKLASRGPIRKDTP
jgi:hypothetical protein